MKEKGLPFWAYLLALSPFGAYTKSQRQWIIDRDGDKCQAPFRHTVDTEHPKQVHHILPQGYCKRVGIRNPDYPENGITLCQNAHDVIHPDVPTARREYHQDTGSFGKLREQRSKKLDRREPYWNTQFDRQMSAIAVKNTQNYIEDHPWPEKPKKK